jgi:hypothetical protein
MKNRGAFMSYMLNNLAFAGGIQELSFDELSYVSGGDIGDDNGLDSPWDDAMLGKKSQRERGINWIRVLDQAVGGAVMGAAGAATTACVAAALATGGPGCLAVVVPAAAAGAAGGAVVGAGTELWNQTAPPPAA